MDRPDRIALAAVVVSAAGLAAVVQRAVVRLFAKPHPLGESDPDGNPRTIPVRVGGLVVWHSRAEWERFWAGVDRDAAEALRDE